MAVVISMHERIERNVVRSHDGCWEWIGGLDSAGYARLYRDGRTLGRAHRVVYELYRGPIPDGLGLDHLCRIRHCVNPDHLEPVTQRENLLRSPLTGPGANARKTHCKRGHEFTPENTLQMPSRGTSRTCRICRNAQHRARYARRVAREALGDSS